MSLAADLRDLGVEEFAWGQVRVVFARGSAPTGPQVVELDVPKSAPALATVYDKIFGGAKPQFPGQG